MHQYVLVPQLPTLGTHEEITELQQELVNVESCFQTAFNAAQEEQNELTIIQTF